MLKVLHMKAREACRKRLHLHKKLTQLGGLHEVIANQIPKPLEIFKELLGWKLLRTATRCKRLERLQADALW